VKLFAAWLPRHFTPSTAPRRLFEQPHAQIGLGDKIIMVLHDWGSALGFDWAMRNRDRVQGIVYMEAIVTPLTWADWPENARRTFQSFRSESGEEMILEKNMFVERVLPASIIRRLSEEEMAATASRSRVRARTAGPTLTWPRMIPIEGKPADVVKVVENYAAWLAETDVPKLFIFSSSGRPQSHPDQDPHGVGAGWMAGLPAACHGTQKSKMRAEVCRVIR
jgi:haloalkane dehalogenase